MENPYELPKKLSEEPEKHNNSEILIRPGTYDLTYIGDWLPEEQPRCFKIDTITSIPNDTFLSIKKACSLGLPIPHDFIKNNPSPSYFFMSSWVHFAQEEQKISICFQAYPRSTGDSMCRGNAATVTIHLPYDYRFESFREDDQVVENQRKVSIWDKFNLFKRG